MKLIVRHFFRDLGSFYVTNFFQTLYTKLQTNFPTYSFSIENDSSYESNGYGSIYSCMNFSIVNPDNKKYIVLSFFDNWRYLFMKHLGWNPELMTQMFYCGGFNYLDYFYWKDYNWHNNDVYLPEDIANRYSSFFYGPYNTNYENIENYIYDNYNIEKTLPQLYFRGYMWDFRDRMIKEINQEDILIIDKNQNDNNLDYKDYLENLTHYRAALSLPGGTEVCNRDIECFSVGVPVIRPTLSVNYPDPLIPNYHYISCYDYCKYWDGDASYLSYSDFQKSLIDTWDKVKNNTPYLKFISKNAREWYSRNCTLEANTNYVLSKLNLELLYD